MTQVAQTDFRDADNWLEEVAQATKTCEDAQWLDWDDSGLNEPEGLIHAVLRNGEALEYILAQRLRWKHNDNEDDIVKFRFLTQQELDDFLEATRPSAELAEKASRFINSFYRELYEVNAQLDKKGMASGTLSMIMNFSLNCSLTESGTLANISNADLRRIANELMIQATSR